MNRVIVVGSVNQDLTMRVTALPRAGLTIRALETLRSDGGKGANQAVAARRAGGDVWFVGGIGGDDPGPRLRASLRAEGIHTPALVAFPEETSGIAVVTVDATGENSIVISAGANDRVDERFARTQLEKVPTYRGDVLLTCFEIPAGGVLAGLRHARDNGAEAIVNPSPIRPIGEELWSLGPTVICNQHEATQLTGTSDVEEALRRLASRTDNDVIVTLGGSGVLAVLDGSFCQYPAQKVQVVDTTGAGDVFCGTFAAHRAAGEPKADAVAAAIKAAGQAVRVKGARPPLTSRP